MASLPPFNPAWYGRLGRGFIDLHQRVSALETSGAPASGNISASQVTSGVLARARLGTGTADASTVLYGDGTWKPAPSGGSTGSVTWDGVSGKPTFATVATSGSYADLTNKPTIPTTFAASAITSGVIGTGRLGTGTASATTFLAGDGSWKTPPSGGGSGTGTDITIRQNADGSWPTVSNRVAGAHYRWLAAYDGTKWPTAQNGAASGDELVGADATVIP